MNALPGPIAHLHQEMIREAQKHPDLLTAYARDLHVHDAERLALAAPGDEFVWLLRADGTELLALRHGHEPLTLTYWLPRPGTSASSSPDPRTYHLRIPDESGHGGHCREIRHDEAAALAAQPIDETRLVPGTRVFTRRMLLGTSSRYARAARLPTGGPARIGGRLTEARVQIEWTDEAGDTATAPAAATDLIIAAEST